MNDTRAPLGTAAAPFVATSVATSTIASVLLVDDQPAKLLSYEAILGDLQLRCVRAYSGREALKQLLLQEFAAIVLDVSMPDMDGFETARMIREHPRLERTPIIFVTGINVSEFDQLKGYEVGAIDYIAVPVIPEILRSKIAVLVELHQRRSALQAVNKSLAEARAELESRHASVIAQREAEHEAIFEHPSHVNAVIEVVRDSDGKIRDWRYRNANRSAAALVGLQREQIIGRCIGQVLPPPRVAHVAACYAQVLASGQIARYEMTYGSADYLVTVYRMNAECIVTSGIDITDRKNAEAGMRRSEARYQALLENAPVAVAHNALDGRFEYVNRAFCKLVGYSADELLQKRWQDITHPEDIESDSSLARRVLAGELPDYTIEKRYVRKDGEIVWVNLFGNFVHDSNDRAVQGVAVAIDITEQRRAAADLVESRERLVLAKAAARLGTHDWDIRTGVIKWDERTYELWDLQPGTPVTFETFAQGLHPDDFATMQAAVDRALDPNGDGKYLSVYRVIRRRDGSTCWIEATGRVTFENGKPVRLVGTVQDITERTLAQSQLRSSEERFRELANNIDQFAWTCDEHGQAFWYNDRWYEYTGTREQDMLGLAWSTLHHPDHLERVKTHLEYCLRTGTPWEDTFPLRGKDGNYRWFLSRAVPIRGDDGKVLRWFGTNTDVTDLRGLQEELKQADALKDEFLAMLSHELRNPTAAISNAAQVLSRLLADSEREQPLVNIVQRQVSHLSRLLDDLLDVARITQGRIDLQREHVTLQQCVQGAIETTEPLMREKSHRLTFVPSSQPLWVFADRVRLTQCIANLLNNAAKYTQPGGTVHVRTFEDKGQVGVEIIDSGVGISAELLPRIFELFVQSERPLDRSQGGLGIGLTICRKLAEMHGGTVVGHSAGIGSGATFTLRLPNSQGPSKSMSASNGTRGSQRVLVVDDNRDAADSLALLLQLQGHDALTVYSGKEALAKGPAYAPQVVLLDIGLPDMDGYEVARRMRIASPAMKLIAVTGYGLEEDKLRSAAAGFDLHLVKPVALSDLEQAFASLLLNSSGM